jgi:alkylation response protein AidB-like acyl-CoA dehydrogenase
MRSCFAMTEPAPGAGSDPAALMSTARKVAGGWLLDDDKHFITSADGAGFAIVMAKSQGPGAPEGASMSLLDAGQSRLAGREPDADHRRGHRRRALAGAAARGVRRR